MGSSVKPVSAVTPAPPKTGKAAAIAALLPRAPAAATRSKPIATGPRDQRRTTQTLQPRRTPRIVAGDARRAYPNLATVPPPPTQALTKPADLNKLTQNPDCRPGQRQIHQREPTGQVRRSRGAATTASACSRRGRGEARRPAPRRAGLRSGAGSAARRRAGSSANRRRPNRHRRRSPSASTGGAAAKGARKSAQPPEPGPMESSLQPPQIGALPQPGQNQPAPPPPHQLSTLRHRTPPTRRRRGRICRRAGSGADAGGDRLGQISAGAAGSQSAAARADPHGDCARRRQAGKAAAADRRSRAGRRHRLFPAIRRRSADADRQTLGKILPRYREQPGPVRVVGYAGVGSGAAQQLNSYRPRSTVPRPSPPP